MNKKLLFGLFVVIVIVIVVVLVIQQSKQEVVQVETREDNGGQEMTRENKGGQEETEKIPAEFDDNLSSAFDELEALDQ